MRSILLAASLALALAGAVAPAEAALPPGISGAWYNPAQSGHGLTVEILDDARALVFWHVFDPDGNPVHLYIEGDVVGDSIAGQAYLGRGMRFGSFDPDLHMLSHWGSVTLAFSGCNAGSLEWQADGPAGAGYAAGSMPLQRLTAIEGLDCHLNDPLLLPAGRFLGSVLWLPDHEFPFHAAVDSDGRLWGTVGIMPTHTYVGPRTFVFAGTPATSPLALDLSVHENLALAGPPQRPSPGGPETVSLEFATQADGRVSGTGFLQDGFHSVTFSRDPDAADPLQRPFDPAELEGLSFSYTALSQFFEHPHVVRFLPGASFCVDTDLETCALRGSIRAEDPGLALFAIAGERGDTQYSGKGWVEYQDDVAQRVVLVATGSGGSHDGAGLGIVAERTP